MLVLAAVFAVVAANVVGDSDSPSQELTRGQAADAARLNAQAEAGVPSAELTAGQVADGARLTAQAEAQAAQEGRLAGLKDLINRGLIPAQTLDDPAPSPSSTSNWSSLDAVQSGEVSPEALDAEIARLQNLAEGGGFVQPRFVNGR